VALQYRLSATNKCSTVPHPGLPLNPARPEDKLPYRGAWLWVGAPALRPAQAARLTTQLMLRDSGPEMIHLMEVPNPDPTLLSARPAHGGRDRHACFGVESVEALATALLAKQVPFTRSNSGRPALFFRDPDGNTLECAETPRWR